MSVGFQQIWSPPDPLQLRIFPATPPRLVHWIFLRIQQNLRVRSGDEIDAQLVADADQVEQHVGHFCAHFIERFRRQVLALSLGEPLKMFEQFGGFNSEGGGQVLGRVELIPVAFSGEDAELDAEGFEVGHGRLFKGIIARNILRISQSENTWRTAAVVMWFDFLCWVEFILSYSISTKQEPKAGHPNVLHSSNRNQGVFLIGPGAGG